MYHHLVLIHSLSHHIHSRAKLKSSCQRLGLFKLASVSKKRVLDENKKLHSKLKQKDDTKVKMQREVKEAVADATFWENSHATLQEEFEEGSMYVLVQAGIHMHSRPPPPPPPLPRVQDKDETPGAVDG